MIKPDPVAVPPFMRLITVTTAGLAWRTTPVASNTGICAPLGDVVAGARGAGAACAGAGPTACNTYAAPPLITPLAANPMTSASTTALNIVRMLFIERILPDRTAVCDL